MKGLERPPMRYTKHSPECLEMDSLTSTHDEAAISDLLHEFRQPLSIIGLSASYLELVIGPQSARAREQVLTIQRQVENLGVLLHDAAAEVRRLRAQCPESLPLTNSESLPLA
jgi:signal transduction histidine kinase